MIYANQPLRHQSKNVQTPLGGPQHKSETFGEHKSIARLVGIELWFPDFPLCNLISLPTEPSTNWVFSVSAVLYTTIHRVIAAGQRSHCARPNCFVCLDSICSCNALAYVHKTNCYQNVLCCLVFCLQCSGVHSCTAWHRLKNADFKNSYVLGSSAMSPGDGSCGFEGVQQPSDSTRYLRNVGIHSPTAQRHLPEDLNSEKHCGENHKSPWHLLIQSKIVPNFVKPSSLPYSQQSARFSFPESA